MKKKDLKRLKIISEANAKSKSSSISSNNRRAKKSAARIERSKQLLSKSCERKQSKKGKRNKVIQIVQNQCINLKTPNTTELIFNWPLKQTNTMKNEFAKRTMNESKLGFIKDRVVTKPGKTRNMFLDNQHTAKAKYMKLLPKKHDVFDDIPAFLNKTVTSDFNSKPLNTTKKTTTKKANLNKSRNIGFIRPSKTEI